jgi:drug/metabolite transporter (DMT)-like permease
MGMWILPLLAHLFSNTGYNIILRHTAAGNKYDPYFIAAMMSTAIAAPGAIGIFAAGIDWSLFNTRIILVFAATIASVIAFHVVNVKALEITEASVFSLLYNFRLGVTEALGIAFLGESVVKLRLAGGVLVFIAGFILSGRSVSRPAGVLFSIAAAVLISVLNAFQKYLITELGYAAYMFPSVLATAGALWLIVLLGKHPVDKAFLKSRASGMLMVFRCLSAHGFTLALSLGALLSISTYVAALTCVTTPIAAIIFLKETDNLAKKVIAGVVALAGVTLIFFAMR